MAVTIAISLFFGLVAALSIMSCSTSVRQALRQFRSIRAELTALDQGYRQSVRMKNVRYRQPQVVFAQA